MGAEAVAAGGGWGTWEELILGGAVLRHGTDDWNAVASELRVRTLYPRAFTPQACKEKYEDLQKRYSGSTAWFEELRKQRVSELKRALAKSEDSIGSLESKIKYLKGEKKHSDGADYGSNETESSPLLQLNSNGNEPFNRETTSNNENSAGSFTRDTITRTNRLFENQEQADLKPSTSASSDEDKDLCVKKLAESNYGRGVVMRKRRGARNRKDHNRAIIKERSVGESDNNLCSNAVSTAAQKETLSYGCGQMIRESSANDHVEDSCALKKDGLIEIFQSVAKGEPAAVFRHRMDSQKRARYRRVIKQHVDIGTIRSRIIGRSITSSKQLFRDLLLVANNALVFYSRRTREYKSAISLRNLVMKEYKKHCVGYYCHEKPASVFIPCNPPVKPRTVRPRPQPRPMPCKDKDKVSEKLEASVIAENVVRVNPDVSDKQSGVNDSVSAKDRKGLKRPGKMKRGLVDGPTKSCGVKQRKRVRR